MASAVAARRPGLISKRGYGAKNMAACDKVTALVVGDPHFKTSNGRETDLLSEAVAKLVAERRPDFVVVLGDILDRFDVVHVVPLRRAVRFLRRLARLAPLFVLIGNHDRQNASEFLTPYHSLAGLDEDGDNLSDDDAGEVGEADDSGGAGEVGEEETVEAGDKLTSGGTGGTCGADEAIRLARPIVAAKVISADIGGRLFVFAPYVPEGRFREALDTLPGWEAATAIFAHQEFRGAKMGAIVSEKGDPWDSDLPLVISGHVHDYQEISSNLLYTGAPMQHGFGDHEDKTVSWFEFGAAEVSHERISLGLPRKKIIRVRAADLDKVDLPSIIGAGAVEIKVVVEGAGAELKAAHKHPSVVAWSRAGARVVYKDLPADSEVTAMMGRLGEMHTRAVSLALRQDEKLEKSSEVSSTAESAILAARTIPFKTLLYCSIQDKPRYVEFYRRIFKQ